MKKNEKILIGVLVLAVIIVILIGVFVKKDDEEVVAQDPNTQQQGESQEEEEQYTTELDDGTKINTSEEFNSSKTYKDLTISNIQFTERDDMSVLLADVTNNGTSAHEPEIVKITILGDNEEVITEIKPVIGDIEAGETVQLNASVTADVANAKDFRIEPAE